MKLKKVLSRSKIKYSPMLHVGPVQPDLHSQLNDPPASRQEPPLRQGAGAHGLSTTSQLTPEKPSGHVQLYWSGAMLTHVPPFKQGSCVPQ